MEKSQYELCVEVLRRLDHAGILKHVILVGSWCTLLYRDFFASRSYSPSLKTRDLDLLIPKPSAIDSQADVAALLRDLGFVVGFTGSKGYLRLEHPQLIVEFLVPERGRTSDKPYPLPQLGMNAQALRFLEFLARNTIVVNVEGIAVALPHPASFALHKLLVGTKRSSPEKQAKDKEAAMRVLHALLDRDQGNLMTAAFDAMPQRWRTKVIHQLTDPRDREVLELLRK